MTGKGTSVRLEDKKTFQTDIKETHERCVICGKRTDVQKDTPVKDRKYYVETAGQLCEDCYVDIYIKLHNDNIFRP